jgi:hypothetical protein
MLGNVFRIRGSNFRMIPNPTTDFWTRIPLKKASWKVTRLTEVFQEKLTELINSERLPDDHVIVEISNTWKSIAPLLSSIKEDKVSDGEEDTLPLDACEAIHDAIDQRTHYLLHTHEIPQAKVLSVVVAHLTKVMAVLEDQSSPLNNIVLANKEDHLLSYYFYNVRPAVIGGLNSQGKPLSRTEQDIRDTIWISLVFRMLCWLLLHDFDKQDVRVVPTDMKGSRMPIYIG